MKFLIVAICLAVVCHSQESGTATADPGTQTCESGPDYTPVNDTYSLDDWEQNPSAFGNSMLGVLSDNPDERSTIQSLLDMMEEQEADTDTRELELTKQLLRGYFNFLPKLMETDDVKGLAFLYANDTENQLEPHILDNYFNNTARNEKYYYDMSSSEKSEFLMESFVWQQVFFVQRTFLLVLKHLINIPYEDYRPADVNEQCYTDVVHTIRSFYINKPWALEMVDATGRPPIGVFKGSLNWVGQYDQCRLIKADRSNISTQETLEKNIFQGSYCDIQMDVKKALPFVDIPVAPGKKLYLKIGLCFPSTCSSTDVHKIMQSVTIFGNSFPEIDKTRCHNEFPLESGKLTTDYAAHFAMAFLGVSVVLTVVATLIEGLLWYQTEEQHEEERQKVRGYNEAFKAETESADNHENGEISQQCGGIKDNISQQAKKNSLTKRLTKTFSLYTNLPSMFSTHQSKSAIKSLDALRVLSINWIILGHMWSIGAVFIPETLANAQFVADKLKDPAAMGIYGALMGVDSFFFISGLLVSYLFLKSSRRDSSKLSWVKQMALYYIHRLIRILPLYGVLILFYAVFGKYLGAGPLFDWQSQNIVNCQTNWWANLLFINNFVNARKMCFGWSWYLSNDMQFYVIAPLILIPLLFKPVIGMIIVGFFMAAHWGVTGYLWYGTGGSSYIQDVDIFYDAYITPYCRIGPYLVGIVLGYIFYKKYAIPNHRRILISVACWLITLTVIGVIVYVQYDDTKTYGVAAATWSPVQRAAFESLSRDAWAVALAWIVYACNNDCAGFIGHMLNWTGWAPLSRMTFSVYLVHPIIMFIYIGNRRDLNYLDNFTTAFMYCGYVLMSYAFGAVLSLIFEMPPAAMEKLILGKVRQPKTQEMGQRADCERTTSTTKL